tara:strand:- start:261 stop:716 length:456 start_codon:yes stop_codon:yes gene_type:complete
MYLFRKIKNKKHLKKMIIYNKKTNKYETIEIEIENLNIPHEIIQDKIIKNLQTQYNTTSKQELENMYDVDYDLNNNLDNLDNLSKLKNKYTKLDNLILYLKHLLLYNYETWTLEDSNSINKIKNIIDYRTTLKELKEEKKNIKLLMNNIIK